MASIIGKKIGMTSVFDANRKSIACTLVEAGPCQIVQVKDQSTDGYNALQVGFLSKKEKHTTKALQGHFTKNGAQSAKILKEFSVFGDYKSGDTYSCDIFKEGEFVDVTSTSKGKGFQGVVKRHNFSGVGGQTHGQHNRGRAPGSLGAGSTPSRVFKGMKMAGRMGGDTVKVPNLKVMKVIPEKNLLVISGCIPGTKGTYVVIEK